MLEPLEPGTPSGGGDEAGTDASLREGLRRLPVPEISPEFDGRVLTAMRGPSPGWRWPALWKTLRPVMGGAACSLVLTAGLYAWTTRLPLESRAHRTPGVPDMIAVNQALERDARDPLAMSYLSLSRRRPTPARSPEIPPVRAPREREDRSSRPMTYPGQRTG